MAERRYEYAPANTLPGLLQRGRGLGARMAAEDPASAAELVYGCIRWEWRWDRQVDDRALYLARLVRDLELPLGPVVELLAGDEGACDRATRVLELLALGGSGEAREALRAYVRDGGERRAEVLESVALVWPVEWWGDLTDAGPVPQEPAPHRRGRRDPLPEHGEVGDLAALVAGLERCWVEQVWCGPDGLARGLARFGAEAAGAASLLRRFWLWTPHSYERAAYLEALAGVAPAGLAEVYVESLWDCEADARMLAVGRAPDTPEVRERLGYLSGDPMEDPGVREAARARREARVDG